MSTPPSIPAPPLPEEGQSLSSDCPAGQYPYGYDVDGQQQPCVDVDPCLVEGVLYLDYEVGGTEGTTLWTITPCSLPVEETTTTVVATSHQPVTTLPETGAGTAALSLTAVVLVAAGGLLVKKARRA